MPWLNLMDFIVTRMGKFMHLLLFVRFCFFSRWGLSLLIELLLNSVSCNSFRNYEAKEYSFGGS